MQKQEISIAPFAPSAARPSALPGAWQIAGWQDFDEAVKPALAVLGFAGAGEYGMMQKSGGAECYRIAPDKLWLRAEKAEALSPALAIAKAESRLTTLDISHSRAAINLNGGGAESLMTRVAAADFAAMASGAFVQTAIMGTGVLILRNGKNAFTIFAPKTWSKSIRNYLTTNARP